MLAPWAVAVFVALEFLLYGFGLWSWGYLYIWLLLYLAAGTVLNTMDQHLRPWGIFQMQSGLVQLTVYRVSEHVPVAQSINLLHHLTHAVVCKQRGRATYRLKQAITLTLARWPVR